MRIFPTSRIEVGVGLGRLDARVSSTHKRSGDTAWWIGFIDKNISAAR
jgi:hypothetical protein